MVVDVVAVGGSLFSHGKHLFVFTWACGGDADALCASDFVWVMEAGKKTGEIVAFETADAVMTGGKDATR